MSRWNKRFLASTRGRVIQLLRRGEAPVSDLATALGLTDNAVRAHLTTLERDGLARQAGKRPGLRKPETLYALTPEAELLFPKAYHLLLNVLVDMLGERLSPDEVDALLRGVGRRIGEMQRRTMPEADLRARVAEAGHVLEDLGGLAELEERDGRFVICGLSCPLAAATHHPEVCSLAESLLSEIVGTPVQQRCEREGRPRCVFEVG